MQALAHFTERAQQAAAALGVEEAAVGFQQQSACACALEDLLLWVSTYRCGN